MRIAYFCHSLCSDWNHGIAHFLPGVVSELPERGHDVRVFEPADAWSGASAGRVRGETRRRVRQELPEPLEHALRPREPRSRRGHRGRGRCHRARVERPRPYRAAQSLFGDDDFLMAEDDRLPEFPETFDLVLFMGLLYRLRYPLLGLDLAARRSRGLFVFQTLTTPDEQITETPHDLDIDDRHLMDRPGWPRMAFIEHSVASDSTDWWAPNAACCEAMLRSARLTIVARPGHEIYLCRAPGAGAGRPQRAREPRPPGAT